MRTTSRFPSFMTPSAFKVHHPHLHLCSDIYTSTYSYTYICQAYDDDES
jgi:hypothetical protein